MRAQSIIPQVSIEEDAFDFGGVTFGDSKTLPLTLVNDSNIEARLILDLRELPEFEVSISPEMLDDDVASEIMVPMTDEIKNLNDLNDVDPEELRDPEDELEEEDEEEEEEEKRYVQITVSKTSPYLCS